MTGRRITDVLTVAVAGLVLALAPAAQAGFTGQLGILDEAWFEANPINPGTGAPWQTGDTYHLVFVTFGTHNGISTDIGVYNAFVQAAADAAGIGATESVTWYAIGSTVTVDAKDNAVVSAPVYNMSANMLPELVATNAGDMWDGDITGPILYAENREIPDYGTYPPAQYAWTGSDPSGVADRPLGSAKPMVGQSNKADGEWIACYWAACPQAQGFRLYALSEPLQVLGSGITLSSLSATQITATSATLRATLEVPHTNAVVSVYWGPTDGTNNPAAWSNSAPVGSWTNVASTNLSVPTTGLTSGTLYYYTFRGTNAATNIWASASESFETASTPSVDNGDGAVTNVAGQATLQGNLTGGGAADIYIYWGRSDGGQSTNYENVVHVTDVAEGAFSNTVTAGYGFTYYYICFASNDVGTAWAAASTNFTPAEPEHGYAYSNGLRGSMFQPTPRTSTPVDMTGARYSNSFTRVFTGDKANTILTMTQATSPAELADKNIVLYNTANTWAEFGGSPGSDFVAALCGRFFPEETGSYNFSWSQDDRGWMFIDIDDDGVFDAGDSVGSWAWSGNGSKNLTAGQGYNFIFFSHEFGGGDNLDFNYTPPSSGQVDVNPTTQAPQWRYACLLWPDLSIANTPVTDLTTNSVTLKGNLQADGYGFDVYVFYGTNNGHSVAANWETNVFLGTYYSHTGELSYAATDLAATQQYYYAFMATNNLTNIWAQPSGEFFTVGPPTVENGGVMGITQTNATPSANLTAGGAGEVRIYWGLTDRGTDAALWDHTNSFGTVLQGTHSTNVTVLAGAPYFYRAYVTNSISNDWADATGMFTSPVPAVALSVLPTGELAENGGSATVTAALSAPSVSNVTVNFSFDANKDTDYTATADSVVIAAGTLSSNVTLNVTEDDLQEENETITVGIASLVHATNGSPASVSPVITSDDPEVTNSGGESLLTDNSARLNGVLTKGDSATITIYWGTNDAGEVAGSWNTPLSLGSKTEDVAFYTDIGPLLANRQYHYRCYAANASSLGSDWADSTESFTTPGPSVSIDDVSVTEGDSGNANAVFTLSLSTASAIPVSVTATADDGTAVAGTDYVATNAVVTIPAETLSATFTVEVIGNETGISPNLQFVVNLTLPSDCTIADAQGVGTILDDDAADYLAGWSRRVQISFSNYKGGTTLTNWPAVVRFGTNITGFAYTDFTSDTGGDLRFVGEDLTRLLNFEIEQWDTNDESVVWLQIPELPVGGTNIWAYWNNPLDTTLPAGSTNGAVWSEGFAGVWHLKDDVRDSTANANHGAKAGSTETTGVLGSCQLFDGTGDDINCGNSATLKHPNTITASAWMRASSITTWAAIIGRGNDRDYELEYPNGSSMRFRVDNDWRQAPTASVSLDTWYYMVGTYGDGVNNVKIYKDGVLQDTRSTAAITDRNENLWIGSRGGGGEHKGEIDEARVSTVARSADWIMASYSNQVTGSTFAEHGTVEAGLGSAPGTVIILR